MEEDQPFLGGDSNTAVADHHRIFIGDCSDSQLDGYDEPPLSDYCGYSKPFAVLDVIWNLAFVLVSVFVLLTTFREKPSTPLRVWIGGYALHCVLHVGFVYFEYRRTNQSDDDDDDLSVEIGGVGISSSEIHNRVVYQMMSLNLRETSHGKPCFGPFRHYYHPHHHYHLLITTTHLCGMVKTITLSRHGDRPVKPMSSRRTMSPGILIIVKKLESTITVISSVWWVFGFYWIVVGGQSLLQDSPRLYWLAVVFLAFDVFFMIFCIAMACVVFVALFCCFPVVATIAYAMTIAEGASENDIRTLPKFMYHRVNSLRTFGNNRTQEPGELTVDLGSGNSTPQLALHPEDSECCICLYRYVDGVELCTLPCKHHFHYGCISKWLRINATCPLCKFNILRGDESV